MVIGPVVSEILGGGTTPPPQMLLHCQKEQMLLTFKGVRISFLEHGLKGGFEILVVKGGYPKGGSKIKGIKNKGGSDLSPH